MIAGMVERAVGLILLIDTSGVEGSIALAEVSGEPRVIGSATMAGRSSSERLLPELRAMLAAEGVGVGDLRAIAVVRGPGSFTGVRIGVAAAKGLAEALGVQVVGLSRLAVLAAMAREQAPEMVGDLVSLIDAGRGEIFCGRYREDGTEVFEALMTAAAAREACRGAMAVAFEERVAEVMRPVVVRMIATPDAAAGVGIAVARMRAGEFDDVATLDAHYLRSTAAEIVAKAEQRVRDEGARSAS